MTTLLHLAPRLRTRGAVHPLLHTFWAWCLIRSGTRLHGVVLVKHRDKFIFLPFTQLDRQEKHKHIWGAELEVQPQEESCSQC
jgi:hypothetical protein